MQRALGAILLMSLVVGLPGPLARAQEKEEEPSREPPDETRPYFPPPAWKSVEIGNFYLKRNRLRGALSRYKEAVTADPHYAPAYLGLGRVYEKLGLRQKALEAYRRYLDELPSTKDALEAKDVQKAVTRLEKQLRTPRSSPRGHSPQ